MGSKTAGQEVLQYPTICIGEYENIGTGAPHCKEGAMAGKALGKVEGFTVGAVGR